MGRWNLKKNFIIYLKTIQTFLGEPCYTKTIRNARYKSNKPFNLFEIPKS